MDFKFFLSKHKLLLIKKVPQGRLMQTFFKFKIRELPCGSHPFGSCIDWTKKGNANIALVSYEVIKANYLKNYYRIRELYCVS